MLELAERWTVKVHREDRFAIVYERELGLVARRCGLAALATWVALLTYRNKETHLAWPMQRTLAEQLGLTQRQVRRHIRTLRDAGIVVVHRKTDAAGRFTVYELPTVN